RASGVVPANASGDPSPQCLCRPSWEGEQSGAGVRSPGTSPGDAVMTDWRRHVQEIVVARAVELLERAGVPVGAVMPDFINCLVRVVVREGVDVPDEVERQLREETRIGMLVDEPPRFRYTRHLRP